MTKDEIKKALETCSKDEDCDKCPYCNHYYCDRALLKDALVLITKQENEIEQLEAEKKQAQVDTINIIVEYCENQNHWNELKDCKLFGGKSDDLRVFLNGIFKENNNEKA